MEVLEALKRSDTSIVHRLARGTYERSDSGQTILHLMARWSTSSRAGRKNLIYFSPLLFRFSFAFFFLLSFCSFSLHCSLPLGSLSPQPTREAMEAVVRALTRMLEHRDRRGRSPLHAACAEGNEQLVCALENQKGEILNFILRQRCQKLKCLEMVMTCSLSQRCAAC
jgi:hypothetical protein